jgi:hypothetical protein
MAQVKTVELKIDAEEALKRLDAVEKELAEINKTAKQTEKGTTALATGFRGIGLAWKAIGIGAVISALQFLADKFSANQQILDKVNIASAVFGDILNQIGTVVVSVVKGLGLLGKAVGKVLKGEFKEAGQIAKESFDGVKEAVVGNNESFSDFIKNAKGAAKESVQFGKDLINLRNEVKLAEAQQRQLQLTFQKEAEIQRQIRDDISLTFEERIAANEELGRILDEQFAEEEALAQKKVELAELELSRNKGNIDLQVALINAKTELADLDERITGQRSEQLTNLNALEKEQADAIQSTIDAENKRLADQKKTASQSVQIADKEAKAKAKIEKALAQQKINMVAGSLGAVSNLIGKDSAAGKALAVAQATISTYSAAAAALAPPPVGAGPILGPIAAGIAVATGLKSVRDIMKTKLPSTYGGDGGGGSLPSIEAPSVPDSPIDDVEEGPTGLGAFIPNIESITTATQPIQAYVVENDISSSQALQEELEVQATL